MTYTEGTLKAFDGLREPTFEWYAVTLLAVVFYVYTSEVKKARATKNWDAIIAGLTFIGMDFFNETWNGWILHFTGRAAFWTEVGPTALRILVGLNIETVFMFLLSGIIFHNLWGVPEVIVAPKVSPRSRSKASAAAAAAAASDSVKFQKILGLPEPWFWAIGFSVFCVSVEWYLNMAGLLIWEYSFWNRTLHGSILIFLIGYFHFYAAAIFMLTFIKTLRTRVIILVVWFTAVLAINIVCIGFLGWKY